MRNKLLLIAIGLSVVSVASFSGENKSVPPKGVPIPDAVKAELEKGVAALRAEIYALNSELKDKPKLLDLLPDVEIFSNAVRFSIEDSMFYETDAAKSTAEFNTAKKMLEMGAERAKQLRAGQASWTTQTGRVVRGYRSELDGTAIPYGLLVPAAFKAGDAPRRLDFWFHGRDEKLSELRFISGCLKSNGEFSPENAFVLHPYGRLCNAYKFAGEADVFEAYRHAYTHYPVDSAKVSVRGFSMGGAATWHLGTHYAGHWAAVNPGAGFVDVKNYQKVDLKTTKIPWYEQKLWHLYDSADYALNLRNTTLVAYSGEEDAQKAAADLMEKMLAAEGIRMTHIIGAKTGHKYESKAKAEVMALVDAAANKGRDKQPREIHFTTFTLKYNQLAWVEIDALEKHWERARVDAVVGDNSLNVKTANVSALLLSYDFPSSDTPVKVSIDGTEITARAPNQHKAWNVALLKNDGKWTQGMLPQNELRKQHNLQGPIDDAFMQSFLMVRSTGKALSAKSEGWVKAELDDALTQWRKQMRGEARVKNDADVSDADISEHNLILWGDPSSNKILAKIVDKLPLKWSAQDIEVGAKKFSAEKSIPVLIYPNPLNPKKYVVLNCGFTFARFGAASNSQQTPKLPDWAIVNMDVPPAQRLASGVEDAGFFGEKWELKDAR